MATVTLTENEISVTADTMRKAKKLLREALEAAQKHATEEREKQERANVCAQSRAYNFINQKHSRNKMPRTWKLLSPAQAIASGDVKLISNECGNRRFRITSWEGTEPQSAEIDFYVRDTLAGFIVGNAGVIGLSIGFYHDENGAPRVYGLGIYSGKYNYFEAFGVSPEDFGTPEEREAPAAAETSTEETAEPQTTEETAERVETWESVEA